MSRMPAISVVIAMFNARKYIESCIESILGQTFSDFEIVIIDDCSTDGCFELVREKYSEDPRVRVFCRDQNGGSGLARNDGIRAARGRYIFAVDSDDMLVQNALEIFYQIAEETQAEVIHTTQSYVLLEENVESAPHVQKTGDWDPILGWQTENIEERIRREQFIARTRSPLWYNLYRRDFLIQKGIWLPAMRIAEDSLFSLKVLCLAKKYYKIDSAIYVYRELNRDSLSNSNREENLRRFIRALPTMLDYIHGIFSRSDLISKPSRDLQIGAELAEISHIIHSYHLVKSPATMDRNFIDALFDEVTRLPEFSSPEFVAELIKIILHDNTH